MIDSKTDKKQKRQLIRHTCINNSIENDEIMIKRFNLEQREYN